jgi:hypothetical protein
MGIGAIVLGVFAFICMMGGAVLSLVPFLGTMLSFLAPVLALAGIVLGGVALSRAKQGSGESEGLAIGGLVTSIIAFIPSMIVALTCGLCNTCVTASYIDPDLMAYDAGPHDAGVAPNAPIPPPPFTNAPPVIPPVPASTLPSTIPPTGVPPTSDVPVIPATAVPPPTELTPPPSMPPPPLPAGPTTSAPTPGQR